MFQMPMSSPMMTTMFGFAAGACATTGAVAPSAMAPPASSMVNKCFTLMSSLRCID